jgi:hypothetical protein
MSRGVTRSSTPGLRAYIDTAEAEFRQAVVH